MHVDIERQSGSKVALTITVEPEMLEQRMEQLYQQQARRITVPGFRPGKAPRKMIEERVDRSRLMHHAIDAVIETTFRQALRENNLFPIEQGEIQDINPGDDMSLTYKVLLSVLPEVKLGEYKGLEIHAFHTNVTDEMVQTEIDRLIERSTDFVEITDDGIQAGDYATIDYTMKLGGEPYPAGDATGYPLEVGSDTFFPELNEGLLGLQLGETTTVTHQYPEEYTDENLAGKTAEFDITVQMVRRRVKQEPTDEWVQLISNGSMQTMDDLRERIRQNLVSLADRSDRDQLRNELVRKALACAEVDLPEVQVQEEYEHLMEELHHRLAQERLDLATYAEMTDTTVGNIENERMIMARDLVRRSLVLGEIARIEGISVADEEIDATLAMDLFSQTPNISRGDLTREVKKLRKEYEKSGHLDNLEGRIRFQKVVTFLEQHANIISEAGAETPAEESSAAPAPEESAE